MSENTSTSQAQHAGVRLDPVERAIADVAAGRAVVVVDDETRENEGDVIFAASRATPELMAFTVRHSSGVICVPMPGAMLDRLEIPLMTPHNRDRLRTAYTISVDARDGVTTGISAGGRPGAHRAGAGRLGDRAVGADPPGSCLPAARPRGRRAGTSGTHRGGRRPGPARRAGPRPGCWSRWSTTTAR